MEPARLAASKHRKALSRPQINRGPEIEKNITMLCEIVFRNFLENFSSPGRTPTGRKRWYFGLFWAWGTQRNPGRSPKIEKRNFPVLGVPKRRKTSYHAIRDGCPQLSCSLRFDRLDPHGQENTKYEDFRPCWPRTAVGTWRNPRTGPKTGK